MPMASNPNEAGIRASSVEAQGPKRFSGVLRALCSVTDAFEVL